MTVLVMPALALTVAPILAARFGVPIGRHTVVNVMRWPGFIATSSELHQGGVGSLRWLLLAVATVWGALPSRTAGMAGNSRRATTPRIDELLTTLPIGTVSCSTMTGPAPLTVDLGSVLLRVAQQDADAFAAFYDRTSGRVYGLVSRVLRDAGYSEETTQEIYLEVWRTAAAYDPAKGSPLAWLLTIAHRRAVDRVRSEQAGTKREARYGAANVDRAGDVVAESAIGRDERRRVTECIGGLTDAQRECIGLAYYGGLTYVQVSQRLKTNLSTIKSRMRDGLRGLRNCLDVT